MTMFMSVIGDRQRQCDSIISAKGIHHTRGILMFCTWWVDFALTRPDGSCLTCGFNTVLCPAPASTPRGCDSSNNVGKLGAPHCGQRDSQINIVLTTAPNLRTRSATIGANTAVSHCGVHVPFFVTSINGQLGAPI